MVFQGKGLAETYDGFEASAREKTYVMSARTPLAKINYMAKPDINRAKNTPSTWEVRKVTLQWVRIHNPLIGKRSK